MNEVLKKGTIVLAVAAIGAAVVLGGCSKKDDASKSTTTGTATAATTGATDASGQAVLAPPTSVKTVPTPTTKPGDTSTTGSNQSVTVGGKTEAEWKAALPGLQQAAKASPTDVQALQDLAVAQYQTKDYAGAVATYEQMLKVKDDPTVRNNYANVLRDAGQADAALVQYNLAIKGDTTLTIAYINKASLLASKNRQADAMAAYDALIAANPTYYGGYTSKARLLAAEKKVDEAVKVLNGLIVAAPAYAAAYTTKAQILADAGRKAEAIKALDEGLAKVSTADQARLNAVKKQLGG